MWIKVKYYYINLDNFDFIRKEDNKYINLYKKSFVPGYPYITLSFFHESYNEIPDEFFHGHILSDQEFRQFIEILDGLSDMEVIS